VIGLALRAAGALVPGGAELRALFAFLVSPLGLALIACAFSFAAGWHERSLSDRSAGLAQAARLQQARITELREQARATAAVAERARAREIYAATLAKDLQKKVAAYETQLAKKAPSGAARRACLLTAADRRRLRRFAHPGDRHRRAAAGRANDLRRAGRRP